MKDVEIIGMLKSYVKNTLVGMGALKGAPCQCVITTNADGTHTVTMKWVDNSGVSHTDSFDVLNGEVGSMEDISDVQITSIADGQVLAYDSTTQKWINTTNSATVASLANIGDVQFTTLVDGQAVVWDDTAKKWKNTNVTITVDNALSNSSENPVQNKVINAALADKVNASSLKTVATTGDYDDLTNKPTLGTAAAANATSSVTQNSTDVLTSGGAYTALNGKANKGTKLSDYGITDAYTKTETDTAITTEIEKLDVTDSATAGSYVTSVSETDGKVSATKEAADATPTASSTKMVQSGGVYTADANEAATRSVMGAKNLIPYPFYNESPWNTNDITFTVNTDNSITISGIATADAYFRLTYNTGDKHVMLKNGISYILSATGYADIAMQLRDSTNTRVESARISDVTYDCISDGNYDVIISVDNGADYSTPVTIYPMVRLATDSNADYQPYAKTNKQLTDEQGYFTEAQWAQISALLT